MNKTILLGIIIGTVLGGLFGLKKVGIIGKEEGVLVATEKATNRTITETVNECKW